MLIVVLGSGEEAKQQPNPMYFRSIDVCQYYAKRIPMQYGNYNYSSMIMNIIRQEGLAAFYKGFIPKILIRI